MTIRVVVVDDQELVRSGFSMILDAQPDIEVVAEAADGEEAVAVTQRVRPDVVLMDVRMPRMDGIEATRRLAGPGVDDPVKVVILTTFDLDEYVFDALQAGASGFLLKDSGAKTSCMRCAWWRPATRCSRPSITRRLIEDFARRPDCRAQCRGSDSTHAPRAGGARAHRSGRATTPRSARRSSSARRP